MAQRWSSPRSTAHLSTTSCLHVFLWRPLSIQRMFSGSEALWKLLLTVLSPPYTNLRDAFNDRPRQEMRKVRKAIGLPTSEDVGVLATGLKSLLDAVESYIECKLGSAAVTSPHLLALYGEDVGDAFDYLNLYWLRFPVRYRHLRETSAAYAGYGFGLCSNYTDLRACKDEL